MRKSSMRQNTIPINLDLLLKLKDHTVMLAEPVRVQLFHLHNHLLEAKSSGWIMHRTLVTGVTIKRPWQTLEFHTNQLLKLKAHTVMLEEMVRVQPFHLHNHLSEVKNNGWIMLKTSAIGVTHNKLLQTLESHTLLLWLKLRNKILLHLCLKDRLLMESLVNQDTLEVQLPHLLNHSLEERSNGFQTLKTLKTGESNKWRLQTQEFHMPLLWFKLGNKILHHLCLKVKLLTELLVKLVTLEVQPPHLLNHSLEEKNNGFQTLKTLKTGEFNRWK
jgi:hypothetical protein